MVNIAQPTEGSHDQISPIGESAHRTRSVSESRLQSQAQESFEEEKSRKSRECIVLFGIVWLIFVVVLVALYFGGNWFIHGSIQLSVTEIVALSVFILFISVFLACVTCRCIYRSSSEERNVLVSSDESEKVREVGQRERGVDNRDVCGDQLELEFEVVEVVEEKADKDQALGAGTNGRSVPKVEREVKEEKNQRSVVASGEPASDVAPEVPPRGVEKKVSSASFGTANKNNLALGNKRAQDNDQFFPDANLFQQGKVSVPTGADQSRVQELEKRTNDGCDLSIREQSGATILNSGLGHEKAQDSNQFFPDANLFQQGKVSVPTGADQSRVQELEKRTNDGCDLSIREQSGATILNSGLGHEKAQDSNQFFPDANLFQQGKVSLPVDVFTGDSKPSAQTAAVSNAAGSKSPLGGSAGTNGRSVPKVEREVKEEKNQRSVVASGEPASDVAPEVPPRGVEKKVSSASFGTANKNNLALGNKRAQDNDQFFPDANLFQQGKVSVPTGADQSRVQELEKRTNDGCDLSIREQSGATILNSGLGHEKAQDSNQFFPDANLFQQGKVSLPVDVFTGDSKPSAQTAAVSNAAGSKSPLGGSAGTNGRSVPKVEREVKEEKNQRSVVAGGEPASDVAPEVPPRGVEKKVSSASFGTANKNNLALGNKRAQDSNQFFPDANLFQQGKVSVPTGADQSRVQELEKRTNDGCDLSIREQSGATILNSGLGHEKAQDSNQFFPDANLFQQGKVSLPVDVFTGDSKPSAQTAAVSNAAGSKSPLGGSAGTNGRSVPKVEREVKEEKNQRSVVASGEPASDVAPEVPPRGVEKKVSSASFGTANKNNLALGNKRAQDNDQFFPDANLFQQGKVSVPTGADQSRVQELEKRTNDGCDLSIREQSGATILNSGLGHEKAQDSNQFFPDANLFQREKVSLPVDVFTGDSKPSAQTAAVSNAAGSSGTARTRSLYQLVTRAVEEQKKAGVNAATPSNKLPEVPSQSTEKRIGNTPSGITEKRNQASGYSEQEYEEYNIAPHVPEPSFSAWENAKLFHDDSPPIKNQQDLPENVGTKSAVGVENSVLTASNGDNIHQDFRGSAGLYEEVEDEQESSALLPSEGRTQYSTDSVAGPSAKNTSVKGKRHFKVKDLQKRINNGIISARIAISDQDSKLNKGLRKSGQAISNLLPGTTAHRGGTSGYERLGSGESAESQLCTPVTIKSQVSLLQDLPENVGTKSAVGVENSVLTASNGDNIHQDFRGSAGLYEEVEDEQESSALLPSEGRTQYSTDSVAGPSAKNTSVKGKRHFKVKDLQKRINNGIISARIAISDQDSKLNKGLRKSGQAISNLLPGTTAHRGGTSGYERLGSGESAESQLCTPVTIKSQVSLLQDLPENVGTKSAVGVENSVLTASNGDNIHQDFRGSAGLHEEVEDEQESSALLPSEGRTQYSTDSVAGPSAKNTSVKGKRHFKVKDLQKRINNGIISARIAISDQDSKLNKGLRKSGQAISNLLPGTTAHRGGTSGYERLGSGESAESQLCTPVTIKSQVSLLQDLPENVGTKSAVGVENSVLTASNEDDIHQDFRGSAGLHEEVEDEQESSALLPSEGRTQYSTDSVAGPSAKNTSAKGERHFKVKDLQKRINNGIISARIAISDQDSKLNKGLRKSGQAISNLLPGTTAHRGGTSGYERLGSGESAESQLCTPVTIKSQVSLLQDLPENVGTKSAVGVENSVLTASNGDNIHQDFRGSAGLHEEVEDEQESSALLPSEGRTQYSTDSVAGPSAKNTSAKGERHFKVKDLQKRINNGIISARIAISDQDSKLNKGLRKSGQAISNLLPGTTAHRGGTSGYERLGSPSTRLFLEQSKENESAKPQPGGPLVTIESQVSLSEDLPENVGTLGFVIPNGSVLINIPKEVFSEQECESRGMSFEFTKEGGKVIIVNGSITHTSELGLENIVLNPREEDFLYGTSKYVKIMMKHDFPAWMKVESCVPRNFISAIGAGSTLGNVYNVRLEGATTPDSILSAMLLTPDKKVLQPILVCYITYRIKQLQAYLAKSGAVDNTSVGVLRSAVPGFLRSKEGEEFAYDLIVHKKEFLSVLDLNIINEAYVSILGAALAETAKASFSRIADLKHGISREAITKLCLISSSVREFLRPLENCEKEKLLREFLTDYRLRSTVIEMSIKLVTAKILRKNVGVSAAIEAFPCFCDYIPGLKESILLILAASRGESYSSVENAVSIKDRGVFSALGIIAGFRKTAIGRACKSHSNVKKMMDIYEEEINQKVRKYEVSIIALAKAEIEIKKLGLRKKARTGNEYSLDLAESENCSTCKNDLNVVDGADFQYKASVSDYEEECLIKGANAGPEKKGIRRLFAGNSKQKLKAAHEKAHEVEHSGKKPKHFAAGLKNAMNFSGITVDSSTLQSGTIKLLKQVVPQNGGRKLEVYRRFVREVEKSYDDYVMSQQDSCATKKWCSKELESILNELDYEIISRMVAYSVAFEFRNRDCKKFMTYDEMEMRGKRFTCSYFPDKVWSPEYRMAECMSSRSDLGGDFLSSNVNDMLLCLSPVESLHLVNLPEKSPSDISNLDKALDLLTGGDCIESVAVGTQGVLSPLRI